MWDSLILMGSSSSESLKMSWQIFMQAFAAVVLLIGGGYYVVCATKVVQRILQNEIKLPRWIQWLDTFFPKKKYEGLGVVWQYRIIGLFAIGFGLRLVWSLLKHL